MIFRSPLPDLEIPEATDFSSFAFERARQQPSKTALIDVGSGGVVATMNPLFTLREMQNELADARPRWLLAAPEVMERAREAAQSMGGVAQVFALGEAPGVLPLRALAEGDHAPPTIHVANTAEEVALLLYSSGTTGLPKGVMLTHRGMIAALLQLYSGDLARQDDVLVAISSLRSILCAAAPLGPELEQAAADRLRCAVRQGYGMTEATGPVTTSLLEPWEIRRGSVGQLVPSTEARIVDLETGAELEPRQIGEVLVRGPQVAKGYLRNPDATASTIELDGWLHTGDVGYADADGYFSIVDRVKEIIKYKAYRVAPAELEDILGSHPKVADVAVIPSPAPEVGDVPKAFVVPSGEVTAEELMAYVADRVAPYKKVREVEFVQSIPKSASGKILRRVLIERERAAAT